IENADHDRSASISDDDRRGGVPPNQHVHEDKQKDATDRRRRLDGLGPPDPQALGTLRLFLSALFYQAFCVLALLTMQAGVDLQSFEPIREGVDTGAWMPDFQRAMDHTSLNSVYSFVSFLSILSYFGSSQLIFEGS